MDLENIFQFLASEDWSQVRRHKKTLSMRPILYATATPILYATATYNYALAKWLDEKLKPLSINSYTINDTFSFAKEVQELVSSESDILVSYDATSLFTNVPLDYTMDLLVDKAFSNNWFCTTYDLNISQQDLDVLLKLATKDQLFQFNNKLYQQTDGVAMGSPLGPLLANAFLCHIEETLESRNLLPSYYKRYVDDTLAVMRDQHAAQDFLHVLNACHPSTQFTMELSLDRKLPFLGILLEKRGNRIMTIVHRKPTNKGLLLHYQSHQDNRYKKSLLVTMIQRAHSLSSTNDLFNKECNEIKTIFQKLQLSL